VFLVGTDKTTVISIGSQDFTVLEFQGVIGANPIMFSDEGACHQARYSTFVGVGNIQTGVIFPERFFYNFHWVESCIQAAIDLAIVDRNARNFAKVFLKLWHAGMHDAGSNQIDV